MLRLPRIISIASLALVAALSFGNAQAQISFIVVVQDPAGFGFNDVTPRLSDITGESTTLGQDRLDCFVAAAEVWAQDLNITVPVRVDANFESLPGSPILAVLAGAGPNTIFHTFVGAPLTSTWFTVAEANQLAGIDLDPDELLLGLTVFDDLSITFNVDIDETCDTCDLGSITWYYGIDGNPPADKIDFFTVVLHELTHGLGFITTMDLGAVDPEATGFPEAGLMDIFTAQLRQEGSVNQDFTDMTLAERSEALISGEVVWKGERVRGRQGGTQPMFAPDPIAPGSSISHWAFTEEPGDPHLLMEPFIFGAFAELGVELWAFQDILWPIGTPLNPDFVYVNFLYRGIETGGFGYPFNTAREGMDAANPSATIRFAPGSTPETGTFVKPATWISAGGSVRLGVLPE